MPIKQTTPMSQIDKYIQRQLQRQERVLIRTLMYAGEQCVNEARSYNGKAYQDQTGNLRSSVGYIVTIDGKIKASSAFEEVRNGQEGAKVGKSYAQKLVARYPQGAVLIVVAGMNYAKFVAAKGYNVLQSAELKAEQIIPQLLKQLGNLNGQQ